MTSAWPPLPNYADWQATCDTLHAHTQVLGKLAVALAPPEPQLQHAALRLTARGWETPPLPVPDGSGAIVAALDLHTHEAVVEHSDGRARRISLTPHRAVGEVTRDVLEAARAVAGDDIAINPTPQEVPWTAPLDADEEHATYDPAGHCVLRRGDARGAGTGASACALPRPGDAGQCLVGLVRPRRQPVLRGTRHAAVRRLHHAQRDDRPGGRLRLVARRQSVRRASVLRVRLPDSAGICPDLPGTGAGALGCGAR